MKNIKTKNPDGTYSGHFELNDGTKVFYNSGGDESLCFWMAVAQSQKKYENSNEIALINDAKELKTSAFQQLLHICSQQTFQIKDKMLIIICHFSMLQNDYIIFSQTTKTFSLKIDYKSNK